MIRTLGRWLFLGSIYSLLFWGAVRAQTISEWGGDLHWDAPPAKPGVTVTGYNAYKGTTPGGPYTRINTALITAPPFTDPAAAPGDCYVVRAIGSTGFESPDSNELCVIAPNPPLFIRFFQAVAAVFHWLFSWV